MPVVSMLNVKLLVTRNNVLVQLTLLEIQQQNVHQTRMSVPQVHVVRMPNAKTWLVATAVNVDLAALETHSLDVCVVDL